MVTASAVSSTCVGTASGGVPGIAESPLVSGDPGAAGVFTGLSSGSSGVSGAPLHAKSTRTTALTAAMRMQRDDGAGRAPLLDAQFDAPVHRATHFGLVGLDGSLAAEALA